MDIGLKNVVGTPYVLLFIDNEGVKYNRDGIVAYAQKRCNLMIDREEVTRETVIELLLNIIWLGVSE